MEDSMELGCRAHDFGKLPVADLARKIREKGFSYAQLALTKAIAEVDAGPGELGPGLAELVVAAFRREHVRIAVLGSYFNPVHPDPAERRRGAERFKELLRRCKDFGCRLVATETGSLNADFSPHPGNAGEGAFALFVETMRDIAAEAERSGSLACIEGVARHVVHDPARMRLALSEIGSSSVQVLFDPVNFLDLGNYRGQERIIEDSFELFGDRIVAVHAKDFTVEGGGLRTAPAGSGLLDYRRLFRLLKARKPPVYVILEDLPPEAMEGAIRFVREAWEGA
jgi:L-ribulose-5-phosphate 3-epimerase